MSQKRIGQALDEAAQKWRRLAEKRRAHFLELYQSGCWKFLYTEKRILELARDATQQSERWAKIAPPVRDIAGQQAGQKHIDDAA